MTLSLITGVAGTGKSTIAAILRDKGFQAVDIEMENGLCGWRSKETGAFRERPDDGGAAFMARHDWVCDTVKLKAFVETLAGDAILVGNLSNLRDFIDIFDHVFLLQCREDTIAHRLETRITNSFGKNPEERDSVLHTYKEFEEWVLAQGAHPLNNDADAEKTIEKILAKLNMKVNEDEHNHMG